MIYIKRATYSFILMFNIIFVVGEMREVISNDLSIVSAQTDILPHKVTHLKRK